MSRGLTLTEIIDRFGPLVTTDIPIEQAIQEAVDTIYDMGRWPGTTYELQIAEGDFSPGEQQGEVFMHLAQSVYDGVIGFRNNFMGFGIQDIVSLYRISVNSGDNCFIDFGLVEVDQGAGPVTARKYRAPVNWQASNQQPLFALMKVHPPVLAPDDIVPVYSLAALKCAVQAVCSEYVADLDRAKFHWDLFDVRMQQSVKQFSGNKQFTMGIDSSLRRRPNQFL